MLTFIEVPSELVVGAALNNVGHVLCLLVDGHGPDGSARGWWCGHFDLDGACLGNLTVQLLQKWGVLEERMGGRVEMAAQLRMLPQDPFPKHSDGACFRMLQACFRL